MEAMLADTEPYGAAGLMKLDEVIDTADTRAVLARALERFAGRPVAEAWKRPLASWPTC